jgi:HEPN domain-containing protein
MTPSVEEALRALRLADQDAAAFFALRDAPGINLATACFHAQQAVEKCLKAVLFKNCIEFPPVHDLVRLARLLSEGGVPLPNSEDDLRKLTPYAVMYRYDDREIGTLTRQEAGEMVEAMRRWAGEIIER